MQGKSEGIEKQEDLTCLYALDAKIPLSPGNSSNHNFCRFISLNPVGYAPIGYVVDRAEPYWNTHESNQTKDRKPLKQVQSLRCR